MTIVLSTNKKNLFDRIFLLLNLDACEKGNQVKTEILLLIWRKNEIFEIVLLETTYPHERNTSRAIKDEKQKKCIKQKNATTLISSGVSFGEIAIIKTVAITNSNQYSQRSTKTGTERPKIYKTSKKI